MSILFEDNIYKHKICRNILINNSHMYYYLIYIEISIEVNRIGDTYLVKVNFLEENNIQKALCSAYLRKDLNDNSVLKKVIKSIECFESVLLKYPAAQVIDEKYKKASEVSEEIKKQLRDIFSEYFSVIE